jgi:hypothetical protein
MISLGPRDAEEPFFEHFIILVPEGKSKAETLVVIADACDAIFSPSVRPRARMLVGKVCPGVAIPRVVFPNGGLENERHGTSETKKKKTREKKTNPLSIRNVGTPSFPMSLPLTVLIETILLGGLISSAQLLSKPLAIRS